MRQQELHTIRASIAGRLRKLAAQQRDYAFFRLNLGVGFQAVAQQDLQRSSLVNPQSLFVGGIRATREQEFGQITPLRMRWLVHQTSRPASEDTGQGGESARPFTARRVIVLNCVRVGVCTAVEEELSHLISGMAAVDWFDA